MIKHKYILCKSSWGIVIGIYGNVYDYDSYDFNAHILGEDGFTKLCEGVYVLFEKELDNRIGPDESYNQMHIADYPYMLEGLHRVSGQILNRAVMQAYCRECGLMPR